VGEPNPQQRSRPSPKRGQKKENNVFAAGFFALPQFPKKGGRRPVQRKRQEGLIPSFIREGRKALRHPRSASFRKSPHRKGRSTSCSHADFLIGKGGVTPLGTVRARDLRSNSGRRPTFDPRRVCLRKGEKRDRLSADPASGGKRFHPRKGTLILIAKASKRSSTKNESKKKNTIKGTILISKGALRGNARTGKSNGVEVKPCKTSRR